MEKERVRPAKLRDRRDTRVVLQGPTTNFARTSLGDAATEELRRAFSLTNVFGLVSRGRGVWTFALN